VSRGVLDAVALEALYTNVSALAHEQLARGLASLESLPLDLPAQPEPGPGVSMEALTLDGLDWGALDPGLASTEAALDAADADAPLAPTPEVLDDVLADLTALGDDGPLLTQPMDATGLAYWLARLDAGDPVLERLVLHVRRLDPTLGG